MRSRRDRIRRSKGAVAIGAIALLLTGGQGAAGATEPQVDLEGWIEVVSPHLTLVTDLDEPTVLGLLQVLEAERRTILDRFVGASGGALPTTIVLFAGEGSYTPFRLVDREGQFFPTAFENLLVVNGGSEQRPVALAAAHEYTHALLAESWGALPLWLHEGLAEYFSTLRPFADRVVLGAPVPGHRAALRNRAFLSFVDLAAVSGRSSLYHGESGSRFYAQSWLTVHYLLSEDERARQLFGGIETLAAADDPERAYATVFGTSVGALDEALRRYLNRPVLPSRVVPLQDDREPLGPAVRSLEPGEVAYRLGLVALEQARWSASTERYALARALLERAVGERPGDGDAHAGLARLEAALGRSRTAQELFERAVYLDALEPRSYAHYAELLRQSLGASGETGGGWVADEAWTEARAGQMLRRALELAPGHPRLESELEVDRSTEESGPPRPPSRPPNRPR